MNETTKKVPSQTGLGRSLLPSAEQVKTHSHLQKVPSKVQGKVPSKANANRRQRSNSRQHQQQGIDQQIWLLHREMADKLLKQPELVIQVQQRLHELYQQRQLKHSAFLFWSCLLDTLSDAELFKSTLLAMDAKTCQYRRKTPMVGLLSEEERQMAQGHFFG